MPFAPAFTGAVVVAAAAVLLLGGCAATLLPPGRRTLFPDLSRPEWTHARMLTPEECDLATLKAEAGFAGIDCDAGDITLASEVSRTLTLNGTSTVFKALALSCPTSGKPKCGCAGITQTGNRPGTGGTFERPLFFFVQPEIKVFQVQLAGLLPPYTSHIRNAACNVPAALAAPVGAALSAYYASLEALYATLLGGPGPGRRARALRAATTPDGVLGPQAPLHPAVAADMVVTVTPAVWAGRAAAFADSDTSPAGRRAKARGASVLASLDPDADVAPVPTWDATVLNASAASLPYIRPEVWEASEAASGTHLGVRLWYAMAWARSEELYLAEAEAEAETQGARGRRLRPCPQCAGKTLAHTLAEVPELAAALGADLSEVHHGHAGKSRRGLQVQPPSLGLAPARAHRELQVGYAAIAVGAYLLVQVNRASAKQTAIEKAIVGVRNVLVGTQAQLDTLSDIQNTTALIVEAQNEQLGAITGSIGTLDAWSRGFVSNTTTTLSHVANLATAMGRASTEAAARYDSLLATIQDSARVQQNLLALRSNASLAALSALADSVAAGHQAVLTAIGDADVAFSGRAQGLVNYARAITAMVDATFGVLHQVLTQETLHGTLTASLYAQADALAPARWRPLWTAASLAPGNKPDAPETWWPGSPRRAVWVDTVVVVQTARPTGVTTDTYAGTAAAAGRAVAAATHVAVQHTATLWCDGVQVVTTVNGAPSSAAALLDLVGPGAACATPVNGSFAAFNATYGRTGGATYNPSRAPLCTCWVVVVTASCPVVLANASSPLLSLTGAGTAWAPRLTTAGLAGTGRSGPGGARAASPCAVDPSGADTLTTGPARVLRTRAAVAAWLGDVACGNATSAWRNVSAGRVAAGLGPTDVTHPLGDTYVFGVRGSVPTDPGAAPPPGALPLVGIALGPNPRSNPVPNLAGGPGTCSGDPSDTRLYTVPVVGGVVTDAWTASWTRATAAFGAVRRGLYGRPHGDVVPESNPFVYDPATASNYLCLYTEYVAVQDGAVGAAPPLEPWVPVNVLTLTATHSKVSVYMPGVPATEPGANNALPPYTAFTTDVDSIEPMASVLPARWLWVADIARCVDAACPLPRVGTFYNTTRASTRVTYNVREEDLGLGPDPLTRAHSLAYVLDQEVGRVGGSPTGALLAAARPFTADLFAAQNGGAALDPHLDGGSIAFSLRGLVPTGSEGVGNGDVVCTGATNPAEGAVCLRLQHYGRLVPALAGVNRNLVGTVAEPCGTGNTQCFAARDATVRAYNLEVPGGVYTTSLYAACPSVDGGLVGLGLGGVTVRAPPAGSAGVWTYRFLCGGPGPGDDPDTDPGAYADALAACTALYSPGVASWRRGPALDPGAATTLPFTSPIANWTLQVATLDPATGLSAVCRSVALDVRTPANVATFGPAVLNITVVTNDDVALAGLAAIRASQDAADTALGAVLLELGLRQELLERATAIGSLFATVRANITATLLQEGAAANETLQAMLDRNGALDAAARDRAAASLTQFNDLAAQLEADAQAFRDGDAAKNAALDVQAARLVQLNSVVGNLTQDLTRLFGLYANQSNATAQAVAAMNTSVVNMINTQSANFALLKALVFGLQTALKTAEQVGRKVWGFAKDIIDTLDIGGLLMLALQVIIGVLICIALVWILARILGFLDLTWLNQQIREREAAYSKLSTSDGTV